MARIILKRNNIGGIYPDISELELGEIAVNTVDGKLFTKILSGGNESIIEIGDGEKSELEKITEDSQTGWALLNDDRSNKDTIGDHAIDFSYTETSSRSGSGTYGASGNYSFVEGYNTTASGYVSHAEGYNTTASGYASHAEGNYTTAGGINSHAEGYSTSASGYASHTEGTYTTASGYASHAEGNETTASAANSHAAGYKTISHNENQTVIGKLNDTTNTETVFEVGIGTYDQKLDVTTRMNALEVEIDGSIIAPQFSISKIDNGVDRVLVTKEWVQTNGGGGGASELEKLTENNKIGWALLNDDRSNKTEIGEHAIDFSYAGASSGNGDFGASGNYSFAEGYDTTASGYTSHAEGYYTTASGDKSHAEGNYTTANGDSSHAEGGSTIAEGYGSHAEGKTTRSRGFVSHAEGYRTIASGNGSHAEGSYTTANGNASHSEGYGTVAQNDYMHAGGKFNIGTATDTICEIGIGVDDHNTANAFEIYTDGRIVAPELTTTLINTNRSLVTKEYVDANGGGGASELEKITEGGNTGWTLLGDDRDTKGDIGEHSIDFSQSPNNSTTQGPTGNYSMAVGQNIVVSGNHSFAAGYELEATGVNSVSFGDHCRSPGRHAFSGGLACHAEGFSSFAFGQDSIVTGSSSCAFGRKVSASNDYMIAVGMYNTGTSTDTVCEVGIGLNDSNTANAFEIYNDGTVTAPEATVSLIDSRGNRTLIHKEYLQNYLLSSDFGNSFPTTDPGVSGRVWNDGGTLKVST